MKSFHDIKQIIASSQPGKIAVTVTSDAGKKTLQVPLTADEIQDVKNQTYRADVVLHELSDSARRRSSSRQRRGASRRRAI